MGQYFYLVNLDKKQFVHAHDIGNGLKIGEQTAWKYSTEVVAKHLAGEHRQHPLIGTWYGDRIGFVGDYGGAEPVPGFDLCQEIADRAEPIHNACDEAGWENIAPQVRDMMTAIYGITYSGDGWLDILEPDGTKVRPFMTPDMMFSRKA